MFKKLAIVAMVLFGVACTNPPQQDDSVGSKIKAGRVCVVGMARSCSLPGCSNAQIACAPDGMSWLPCACPTPQCTPGACQTCTTNGSPGSKTCDSNGQWLGCMTWNEGTCLPGVQRTCLASCVQGTQNCVSSDAGGSWQACQALCTSGSCQSCTSNGVQGTQTCGSGGQWQSCLTWSGNCAAGVQRSCNCPNCATGIQDCVNSDAATGGWTGVWNPCSCGLCTPGACQSCTSNGVQGTQTCGSGGQWQSCLTWSGNCAAGVQRSCNCPNCATGKQDCVRSDAATGGWTGVWNSCSC
jgi:hypothetical protein